MSGPLEKEGREGSGHHPHTRSGHEKGENVSSRYQQQDPAAFPQVTDEPLNVAITGCTSQLAVQLIDQVVFGHKNFKNRVEKIIGLTYGDTEEQEAHSLFDKIPELEVRKLDVGVSDENILRDVLKNVNVVVILAPVVDEGIEICLSLLEAARMENVSFIVTLFPLIGSDPETTYFRNYERIRNKLLEIGIPNAQLSSSLFMDFLKPIIQEGLQKGELTWGLDPEAKFNLVAIDDVARCIMRILYDPNRHFQKSYRLTGLDSITFEQISQELSEKFKKVTYKKYPEVENIRGLMDQHPQIYGGTSYREALVQLFQCIEKKEHDQWITTEHVFELTDRRPMSFSQWLNNERMSLDPENREAT